MTKAKLLEALKDLPEDTPIIILVADAPDVEEAIQDQVAYTIGTQDYAPFELEDVWIREIPYYDEEAAIKPKTSVAILYV